MQAERLRAHAIAQSLFRPVTLKAALHRLGFVQADPIRSPARAQDLILRHRVNDYRIGDLERRYGSLNVEEDYLYAYGFVPRQLCQLLYPRRTTRLPELEQKVLATVRGCGPMHPRELEAHFGGKRVINAWGGYSKATKCALERLHYHGLLRVARRENGIRIYEEAPPAAEPILPNDRFRKLTLLIAHILAPVTEKTLLSIAAPLRRSVPGVPDHRTTLRGLLRSGEVEKQSADGLAYVWPASQPAYEEPPRRVRFLAPFDPLVWDRRRFEHLWQWSYRFEAYTPAAKRIRGYYAMPLLWGERIIGWANANVAGQKLSVQLGFVETRPAERDFGRELEAEVARLEAFLDLSRASHVP